MNETDTTASAGSRRITRTKIALVSIATLLGIAFIGCIVTSYVVTNDCDGLHDAVKKKDEFAVRSFLLRGEDVNAKANDGSTPLHWATIRPIAEALIAKGADVNAKDKSGQSPLDIAGTEEMKALLKKQR